MIFYGDMPFLSYGLDLYQDKIANDKYLALRVSFTMEGHLHTFPIAFRIYNPTYAEMQLQVASALLAEWTKNVFLEYGITVEHLFAGSGDGGSDVRKAMEDFLGGFLCKWCLLHMLNRVSVDAPLVLMLMQVSQRTRRLAR